MKDTWRHSIKEPLTGVFYAFFQPRRLDQKLRETPIWPRLLLLLRMGLFIFPFAYLAVLAARAGLTLMHIAYAGTTDLLVTPLLITITLEIMLGIMFAIFKGTVFPIAVIAGSLFGIIAGIKGGSAAGIAVVLAAAITLGIAFGITAEIPFNISFGIISTIVVTIVNEIVNSIVAGYAKDITLGRIIVGIVLVITCFGICEITRKILPAILKVVISAAILGIIVGIVAGTTAGIVSQESIIEGLIIGILYFIAYFMSSFHLHVYLVSSLSVFKAYNKSRNDPQQVFLYLHRSALHWSNELIYPPLPYLKDILLIYYEVQSERALEEIAFIAAERPRQIGAARAALLEIALLDLERRKQMDEIAEASRFLDKLFPQETKLLDPQWAMFVTRLREASQDAARFRSNPLGRKARLKALQDMERSLMAVRHQSLFQEDTNSSIQSEKGYFVTLLSQCMALFGIKQRRSYSLFHSLTKNLKIAFPNAHPNARLEKVVEVWLELVRQEQEQLNQLPSYIGRIDDPYRPGNALKPDDPLFLGRLDLVQILEMALAKGDHRPTFLMTGERRMGKSSALLQLPRFLGSCFLPIFYDLQSPGIFASTATFLGTIANGIDKELNAHAGLLKPLDYRMLRGFSSSQTPSNTTASSAYNIFDGWLRDVEAILVREEKTLLLLFDEFEKLEEAGRERGFELRLLLDWFRNIIQHHPRIALLFSGVHTFGEMGIAMDMNWSGYFVNVQTLRVSFLHKDEARVLISKPLPDFPSEQIYGDGVVERIIHETGGHPFLVQAVCSALIENLNLKKHDQANAEDVSEAIDLVFERWWDGYFRDLWYRTDQPQRTCLQALHRLQTADLQQIGQESSLQKTAVQRTLQILLKRDLVQRVEGESYRIATPIFSEWVERAQSYP